MKLEEPVELWVVVSFAVGYIISLCLLCLVFWIIYNADVIDDLGEEVAKFLILNPYSILLILLGLVLGFLFFRRYFV
jgi:hypothetical protein